jgi:hypothetical protein
MNCASCAKTPGNPLRCGQCKISVYCSAECQKTDWPFHRRLCKPPASTTQPPQQPKAPSQAPVPAKTATVIKTGESEMAEEKLDWYRHREWRPEEKVEFVPAKISDSTSSMPKSTSKSAWNAADTWEEKDMTTWARQWLETHLTQNSPLGNLTLEKISGDASACFVRGKLRYLFDLEISLKIGKTEIKISDFCDHEEEPQVSKLPRDFAGVEEFKAWIVSKRQAFVAAYQQTVI